MHLRVVKDSMYWVLFRFMGSKNTLATTLLGTNKVHRSRPVGRVAFGLNGRHISWNWPRWVEHSLDWSHDPTFVWSLFGAWTIKRENLFDEGHGSSLKSNKVWQQVFVCYEYTVWKFHNFSITYILREINIPHWAAY